MSCPWSFPLEVRTILSSSFTSLGDLAYRDWKPKRTYLNHYNWKKAFLNNKCNKFKVKEAIKPRDILQRIHRYPTDALTKLTALSIHRIDIHPANVHPLNRKLTLVSVARSDWEKYFSPSPTLSQPPGRCQSIQGFGNYEYLRLKRSTVRVKTLSTKKTQ